MSEAERRAHDGVVASDLRALGVQLEVWAVEDLGRIVDNALILHRVERGASGREGGGREADGSAARRLNRALLRVDVLAYQRTSKA